MLRLVDRGAIFAGWVGIGVAVVVAMSFELIVPVQALVFIVALPAGMLVGFYAEARSGRRRPWSRLVANALYAGLLTALSLAALYTGLRLLFIYADTGYPTYNVPGRPSCPTGPACTFQRYLDEGRGAELAAAGVIDAATFERYALREQANGALILVGAVTAGALLGGALYGFARRTSGVPEEAGAATTAAR